MNFKGFIGPTYNLNSVNVDCQRCVNMYPEIIESGNGKEGSLAYLIGTPGLRKVIEVGTGPIRMIHIDDIGNNFVASGTELYNISYNYLTDTWASELLGNLSTGLLTERPVIAATFSADSFYYNTVFVDGGGVAYYYTTNNITPGLFGTFADFGYSPISLATHVDIIDGYLIYIIPAENKFYVSNFNSLVVDPLSFASSEGNTDRINSLIANGRDLWIFNERSTEVFTNTGNADFPFERVQGGYFEKGCLAPYSPANIENVVFWLGRDEHGQGIVYAAQGITPQRISTHAIEQSISTYANSEGATGYTYQKNGHSFYVLNFAEATWVYDLATKLWHERAYTNEGELERHRADNLAFSPNFNLHLVGDYESNKVYVLDEDVYSDDETEITRMRVTPHLSSGLRRIFCKSFQVDMEVGVGLDGDVQGSDPQAMLTFSDDGGHTWSNEAWTDIGKNIGGVGEYKTRVLWRRLGSFRDRVFKLKITDPVKIRLIGAEINLEEGMS